MENRYPREIMASDGTRFVVRSVTQEDSAELEKFFAGLSEAERWLSQINPTDPETLRQWLDDRDEERTLALVAINTLDQVIAAYALLERHASQCLAHIAHVRILVAPSYRARGLGSRMIMELADLASCMGVEKVVAEFASDMEEIAVKAALNLNFVTLATLKDYVKDRKGGFHDLVIMAKNVGPCLGEF